MKLCVVLPALNEEATIAQIIGRIPRDIPGITEVTVLVVDDGSTDRTRELALAAGALVESHRKNLGVGAAFRTGTARALALGADYMVNIDADGQFRPEEIPRVLEPLLQGKAEFASASRFLDKNCYPQMSRTKFWGNQAMSWLISTLTGRKYYDVSCGFRAYSRDALLHMNLFGEFTYTQESFLDLSFKGIGIVEVPMKIRGTREFGKSRIASNLFSYAYRTAKIILRAFRDYKPLRFFGVIAAVLFALAFALWLFLLGHYIHTGEFTPHKWAGFTGGFFFAMAFITFITGLIADMLGRVRLNQEQILYLLKKGQTPSHATKTGRTDQPGEAPTPASHLIHSGK